MLQSSETQPICQDGSASDELCKRLRDCGSVSISERPNPIGTRLVCHVDAKSPVVRQLQTS